MRSWLIALFLLCVSLCCACFTRAPDNQPHEQVQPTPQAKKGPPDQPKNGQPEWIEFGKAWRQEGTEVQITKAVVGKLILTAIGGGVYDSSDESAIVYFRVLNHSTTKKFNHLSWVRGALYDGPTMKDEFGNSYHISTGATTRIAGFDISKSLYPGDETKDLVAFEKPIAKATRLDIDLPASHCDGKGRIRFRIPVSAFERQQP